MSANALNEYIAEEPAALAAVSGDAAKLALQRGLVTALKSRRQVADELKGLVGEDSDNHSFNAIGMSQYLAAARSKHVLKSKSDARVGIVVASGEILDGHQPPGTIGGESTADLLRLLAFDRMMGKCDSFHNLNQTLSVFTDREGFPLLTPCVRHALPLTLTPLAGTTSPAS
jgi:protease IV